MQLRYLTEITNDNISSCKEIIKIVDDDILDATKIESKSLELKKERFNLNDIVINAMDDITLGKSFVNSKNVQLLYEPLDIELEADKGRTSQVISNLLSNATRYLLSIMDIKKLIQQPISSFIFCRLILVFKI